MWSRIVSFPITLLPAVLPSGSAQARPVVLKLLMSQGCSSCPSAKVLVGELAERTDLLSLKCYGTYWNGLGWKDTISFRGATERQADCAR